VLNSRVVGERHLKLELGRAGQRLNAIQFGGWEGTAPTGRVRIAYRLEPDDYRGGDAVQLGGDPSRASLRLLANAAKPAARC
jgi:single-stranded-DNA-specific exonuclease